MSNDRMIVSLSDVRSEDTSLSSAVSTRFPSAPIVSWMQNKPSLPQRPIRIIETPSAIMAMELLADD